MNLFEKIYNNGVLKLEKNSELIIHWDRDGGFFFGDDNILLAIDKIQQDKFIPEEDKRTIIDILINEYKSIEIKLFEEKLKLTNIRNLISEWIFPNGIHSGIYLPFWEKKFENRQQKIQLKDGWKEELLKEVFYDVNTILIRNKIENYSKEKNSEFLELLHVLKTIVEAKLYIELNINYRKYIRFSD